MKSQIIVLFVLVLLAYCSSSSIKGRRYEKENPSKARMFHKKGGGQGGVQVLLLDTSAFNQPIMDYPITDQEEVVDIDFDGVAELEELTPDETTRAHFADNNEDDDDDEDFIEVDNEQTSRKSKKRNSNLKLKKQNGKKETQKKNAPSGDFKKGANKIRFVQVSDNNKVYSNTDNIVLRRLRTQ